MNNPERRSAMPVQAIQTKYLCPTNSRGSRYKARTQRGSITVSANDALNEEKNHLAVCGALIAKFVREDETKYGTHKNPWNRSTIMGYLADGSACHVFVD